MSVECSSEWSTKAKLSSRAKRPLRDMTSTLSLSHIVTHTATGVVDLIVNSNVQPKICFAINVTKRGTMQKCADLGLLESSTLPVEMLRRRILPFWAQWAQVVTKAG